MTSSPARRRPAIAALALSVCLAVSACSGPPDPLEVEMKKPYLDLTYGRQDQPLPLERAPGSDLGPTTAPGLIAAPVFLDDDPGASGTKPTTSTTAASGIPGGSGNLGPSLPTSACPKGDLFDPAVGEAPNVVSRPPKPGVYRFARAGYVKSETIANDPGYTKFKDWPVRPLSSEVVREVKDVTTISSGAGRSGPSFEFKVVQSEPGPGDTVLRTTTTYLIDPGTGTGTEQDPGGLFIRQIVTERADLPGNGAVDSPLSTKGVETFNPEPPVKMMDMPIVPQTFNPDRSSTGVDPLTGAQLKIVRQTARRERFDACGKVIDVWRVELFLTSEYVNSGSPDASRHPRGYRISGRFYFAPQLGGLIVFDDLLFGLDGENSYRAVIPGRDGPRWFVQKSVSSLLDVEPKPAQ